MIQQCAGSPQHSFSSGEGGSFRRIPGVGAGFLRISPQGSATNISLHFLRVAVAPVHPPGAGFYGAFYLRSHP
jgi:hypothetical protein